MTMFFIYEGDLKTGIYIDRLSRLTGAKIIAAFPTRQEAIDFAVGIVDTSEEDGIQVIRSPENPRVVVERTFSLQNGDDNNLISECEWDSAMNPEEPSEPEPELPGITPEPEPEPQPEISGAVEIVGSAVIGIPLMASVTGDANGKDLQFKWRHRTAGGNFTVILGAVYSEYIPTADDENKYLEVIVTQTDTTGQLVSNTVGPIVEPAPMPELTGVVEIDGNLQVGETLTADLTGLNGGGLPSYQWKKSYDGNTFENIPSAIADYYVLTMDDADTFINLEVSRSGYTGIITSEKVGPIVP